MERTNSYKKTEVGVIPEDWEVRKLGEILDKAKLGGNYPNSEVETEYPLIKMGNIGRGLIDINKIEYISEGYTPLEKDKLQYGDVLFNTRNTLELVGKVAIWRNELSCAYYNSNLLKLEFKSCYVGSNFFMNYIFNTKYSLSKLKRFATGTTSVAAIYTRDLYEINIPLPPLQEQKAIAKVLSDVDELITSIEKLIDKKQKIKQGTMQLLLTGKKRLPGFTGEWEKVKLSNLGKFASGSGFPNKYQNKNEGDYPFFKVSDMNNLGNEKYMKKANNYIDEDVRRQINASLFPKDTIIFAKIGAAIFLERKRLLIQSSCIDNNMMGFIPDKLLCDVGFIYMMILNIELGKLSNTSALPSLSSIDIGQQEILIPKSIEEQKAIAQILSDMDLEIEALEEKLNKYKLIKEGMMEQLLTGKVRLI